jgi:hypothetical protein
VKDLGKSFEGGLTWSFSETADEPVSVCTRSLKLCVSACTKVGDDGEVLVLCFSILERERDRERMEIYRRKLKSVQTPISAS